jgi:hypothetical protein
MKYKKSKVIKGLEKTAKKKFGRRKVSKLIKEINKEMNEREPQFKV